MRDVVVISGAPGAGKSTLAVPLAEALRFPLLSKDVIKEALFDALGHVEADEWSSSRRLGGAAMELLWRLATAFPAVVIEANFRSSSESERTRLTELAMRPVEVYCRAPIDVVAERYANRGARTDHHQVHVARSLPPAAFEEFQQPFGLGPVIEVETTGLIDVDELAQRVRSALVRDF